MSERFVSVALVLLVAFLTWWFISSQISTSEAKAEREVGCLVNQDC